MITNKTSNLCLHDQPLPAAAAQGAGDDMSGVGGAEGASGAEEGLGVSGVEACDEAADAGAAEVDDDYDAVVVGMMFVAWTGNLVQTQWL